MLEVNYKCRCMKDYHTVMVRARATDEDVADWMEKCLIVTVATDHMKLSPLCRATTIDKVLIPVVEDEPIGSQTRLN